MADPIDPMTTPLPELTPLPLTEDVTIKPPDRVLSHGHVAHWTPAYVDNNDGRGAVIGAWHPYCVDCSTAETDYIWPCRLELTEPANPANPEPPAGEGRPVT